jgi:hypothetical protein
MMLAMVKLERFFGHVRLESVDCVGERWERVFHEFNPREVVGSAPAGNESPGDAGRQWIPDCRSGWRNRAHPGGKEVGNWKKWSSKPRVDRTNY